MKKVSMTRNEVRRVAREAKESHAIKIRGRSPTGAPASFTALVVNGEDESFAYIEGGVPIPRDTLRLLNEFVIGRIWSGARPFFTVPKKVLDFKAITGHVTHRWILHMPDFVEDHHTVSDLGVEGVYFPGLHRPEYDPDRELVYQ